MNDLIKPERFKAWDCEPGVPITDPMTSLVQPKTKCGMICEKGYIAISWPHKYHKCRRNGSWTKTRFTCQPDIDSLLQNVENLFEIQQKQFTQLQNDINVLQNQVDDLECACPIFSDPTLYNLPDDYIYSDQTFGTFFFKFYENMDWYSAKKTCEEHGAKLPVPRSIEENSYFATLGQKNGQNRHIWLGINDIAEENRFVDNDDEPISFFNWMSGEPNNAGNEDAVYIPRFQPNNEKWNDLGTQHDFPYALCVFYP